MAHEPGELATKFTGYHNLLRNQGSCGRLFGIDQNSEAQPDEPYTIDSLMDVVTFSFFVSFHAMGTTFAGHSHKEGLVPFWQMPFRPAVPSCSRLRQAWFTRRVDKSTIRRSDHSSIASAQTRAFTARTALG